LATAERKGAARDTLGAEAGCGEGVWCRRWLKKRKKEGCSTARRRGANRAEARDEYELQRVLSCCNGDRRRRAKLDLSSGKPLDYLHRASTLGAAPKLGRVLGGGGVLFGLRRLFRAEKVKAKR
jgi:hypothetical protein